MEQDTSGIRNRVLGVLYDAYQRNPESEVSGQELSHELQLSQDAIRAAVEYLVREGLAEADLFTLNLWVRLTAGGAGLVEDERNREGTAEA